MKTFKSNYHLIVLSVLVLGLAQCKKKETNSFLDFRNTTGLALTVVLEGVAQKAAVGGTARFSGPSGNSVSWTATLDDTTLLGFVPTWGGSDKYPDGEKELFSQDLGVDSNHFFLQIRNISTRTFTTLTVNEGLSAEFNANTSIPNDSLTHSIGYFRAFADSKVKVCTNNTCRSSGNLNYSIDAYGNKRVLVQVDY